MSTRGDRSRPAPDRAGDADAAKTSRRPRRDTGYVGESPADDDEVGRSIPRGDAAVEDVTVAMRHLRTVEEAEEATAEEEDRGAHADDERDDDDKKKGRRRPRKKSASPLLDPSQLRDAGERLLATLLAMKHNGAIEKTRVGLTCLGERLLRSSDATLSALPKAWLAELFERLEEPNQSVKDLIRRSAGIPFGFMAVFLAEPGGAPRHLLHEAMEKLLAVAVRAIFFLRAFRPSVSPSLPLASLSFRAAKQRRRRKPGSLY